MDYSNLVGASITHVVVHVEVDDREVVTACGDVRSLITLSTEPLFAMCEECTA